MAKTFRLDSTIIVTLWAEALQNDLSWNEFIADKVATHEALVEANEECFRFPDGHAAYTKAVGWAQSEYPNKGSDYQLNQARLKVWSDKTYQKINNIRTKFKKPDGSLPNRPKDADKRWGVGRKGKKALAWGDLATLFSEEDYSPDE